MTRCKNCFIDKDLCECMSYTPNDYDNSKPKRSFATIVAYFIIAISILAMVFGATSCNPQKRALKHVQKAVRIDQPTVNKYFADNYNITDSTDVRVIYKEGETITDTITEIEIEYLNDTVFLTKIKTVTVTKTDTIDRSMFERKQDGAKLAQYQDKLNEVGKSLAETEADLKVSESDRKRVKANNTKLGIIIAVYLAIKVLLMWLGSKLPVNGIFNVIRKIF